MSIRLVTRPKKLVLSILGGPREMLSKGALEEGNWQLLCSTMLAAKRRSRRRQEAHVPDFFSLYYPDGAREIALDHNRLGRQLRFADFQTSFSFQQELFVCVCVFRAAPAA